MASGTFRFIIKMCWHNRNSFIYEKNMKWTAAGKDMPDAGKGPQIKFAAPGRISGGNTYNDVGIKGYLSVWISGRRLPHGCGDSRGGSLYAKE